MRNFTSVAMAFALSLVLAIPILPGNASADILPVQHTRLIPQGQPPAPQVSVAKPGASGTPAVTTCLDGIQYGYVYPVDGRLPYQAVQLPLPASGSVLTLDGQYIVVHSQFAAPLKAACAGRHHH